jgi:hypothetical protein
MTDPTFNPQADKREDGKASELPSATVTIPAGEYAELLACRERRQACEFLPDDLRPLPASAIERDQAVAAFLAGRFGQTAIDTLLLECRDRFGDERTPSRSATYRYRDRLRAAKRSSESPLRGAKRRRKPGPWSKIESDPPVAAYIAKVADTASVPRIEQECKRRFGRERAPSRSMIYTYLARLVAKRDPE